MDFALALIAKSTFILIVILVLLKVFQNRAAAFRHWLISICMMVLLVLPILTTTLPPLKIKMLPNKLPFSTTETAITSPPSPIVKPGKSFAYHQEPVEFQISSPDPVEQANTEQESLVSNFRWSWPLFLLVIWPLGFMLMLIRIGRGLYILHQYKKQASPIDDRTYSVLGMLRKKLRIPERVECFVHPGIQTPMMWNSRKAMVLLPSGILQWTPEELEIVLRHELMHIQRKDFYLHLLGFLVLAIYWFHPLLWWLNRRYALEREKACDEAVIQSGINKVQYAEQLLSIAKRMINSSRMSLALQMARPSMVRKRILAALKVPARGKKISGQRKFSLLISSFLVLPFLAAFSPDKLPVIDRFPTVFSLPKAAASSPSVLYSKEEIPVSDEQQHDQTVIEREEITASINQPKFETDTLSLEIIEFPNLTIEHPELLSETLPAPIGFKPIKVNQSQRLYGQWQDGRSQLSVWIKGDFDLYPSEPYLVARTADDIIIVEERKGNRSYKLIISRAPYTGALIQSYINGKPNSWSGIPAGENLYLWTVDNEWKFLGKGMEKWMREHLEAVMIKLQHLQNGIWQTVRSNDEIWENFINEQEDLKANRFVELEELPQWDAISADMNYTPKPQLPLLPLDELPVKTWIEPDIDNSRKLEKIGLDRASKINSGWSGDHGRGKRYGVLINSHGLEGQLNSFHFNLQENLCQNATLELKFYGVENGRPVFRLSEQPIYVETGDRTGWIRKDLRDYNLYSSEDMLVIIEVIAYQGKGRKAGGLFFSQSTGGYNANQDFGEGFRWDFTFVPLAAYFEIAMK